MIARRAVAVACLAAAATAGCRAGLRGGRAFDDPAAPADIATFFTPPAAYRNDFGRHRLPLLFDDGGRVQSAADWPRRRAEIRARWESAMGRWPAILDSPTIETLETVRRESVTQIRVRLGIALDGQMLDGFFLVPDGAGPFPAVLVVYYEAQSGIGFGAPERDYAWQLARRGFVTLSIGTPTARVVPGDHQAARGAPYFGPVGKPITLEPLSALAYIAANAHAVLARRFDVRADRIGIVGHSFGGKWAFFASALYDRFACAAWSDAGIVWDERDRRTQNPKGSVNYWDPWYLGSELGAVAPAEPDRRFRKLPSEGERRTGAYRILIESGHDLVDLHALMAPRPFLVSGGSADLAERWPALNHAIAVNALLGYHDRVAMTGRAGHDPTPLSNRQVYRFFEWWLRDRP